MRRNIDVPRVLAENIGTEKMDFAVMAKRMRPLKTSLSMLIFSVFWLGFTSIFVVTFLGPLFLGREVEFSSGGVPVTAEPGNLGPIVVPALIIGLFVLIGLAMFIYSLYSMSRKGGYSILYFCTSYRIRNVVYLERKC